MSNFNSHSDREIRFPELNDYEMTIVRSRKLPGLSVILGGLITTVITLALLTYVAISTNGEIHLLGYIFTFFVFPISAIAIGFLSGIGYSIVSWLRGCRVPGILLFFVFIIQICAYFTAQYIEYRITNPVFANDGQPVPFWTYYDFQTQQMIFSTENEEDENNPHKTEPLGIFGYGPRLLEILGFAFGGLTPLLLLRMKAHCRRCNIYTKRRTIHLIPSFMPPELLFRSKAKGIIENKDNLVGMAQEGDVFLKAVLEAIARDDLEALRNALQACKHGIVSSHKDVSTLVYLQIAQCPRCGNGILSLAINIKLSHYEGPKQILSVEISNEMISLILEAVQQENIIHASGVPTAQAVASTTNPTIENPPAGQQF